MKRQLAVILAASTILSIHGAAQDATSDPGAVIMSVNTAMGGGRLRALRYTGTGSMNPTGQAYTTGGPWPRFTVTKYAMSIDYALPAMRQELVRIDDARPPRGGGAGGYNATTFQGGIRPIPGDVIQNQTIDGRTQNGAVAFWLTPHGFLKGIAANIATAKTATVRGKRQLSFTAFGKFPITATIDNRNLIEKVEALVDIAYTGDTVIDGTYTEYRDLDGIRVPMHIVMREGGFPTLEVAVAEVRPNSMEAIDTVARATAAAPPQPAPAASTPVERQPEKIAEGVWVLTPGVEGSVLVEFSDYAVMVEAPVGEAYSVAAMASAKRIAPNKPIRYVVNTHHHADHASGMRAYVAEGIPIITHESHRRYYEEQIFRNPHSLNPDRLGRAPKAAMIETVKDKRVLMDGSMALEIHLMRDQPHSEGLLMVYLPKDKLLIQSDAYIPRPGAPPLPAPSPYTTNLVENVSRLKLDVARVIHVHGGISPYSDVLTAAGKSGS